MWGSYATDDDDSAAVCKHHPSLQHPSYATDKNDGAAVCKLFKFTADSSSGSSNLFAIIINTQTPLTGNKNIYIPL